MDFRLGDVFQDAKILQRANEAADWILKNGKGLEEEACRNLKEHIQYSVQKVRSRIHCKRIKYKLRRNVKLSYCEKEKNFQCKNRKTPYTIHVTKTIVTKTKR